MSTLFARLPETIPCVDCMKCVWKIVLDRSVSDLAQLAGEMRDGKSGRVALAWHTLTLVLTVDEIMLEFRQWGSDSCIKIHCISCYIININQYYNSQSHTREL